MASDGRERVARLLYDAHYGQPKGSSLAWPWEKTSMESREVHREMADAVLPLLADARAQAVEALRKYVKHRSACECLLRRCDWREPVYACTCGLDALLPPRSAPRDEGQ